MTGAKGKALALFSVSFIKLKTYLKFELFVDLGW